MAAAPIGPYSPVVRAGDWIITSGQLGLHNGALVEGGVQAETKQVVANLADRLAEHGATLTDVVKTLCILSSLDDFAAFNEAYVEAFGDHRPTRSTFAGGLVRGAKVEIEAWAYKPL
ncbi:MAG: RidA family protein [Acidimicrobiia bacterium]